MDVPVAPLDEILPRLGVDRVDAIKIDVESYELEVLRGASSLLSSQEALVLFMEILSWAEQGSDQQDEILSLLWSFDYLIYRIDCDEATLIRSTNQLLHEQNICAFKPKLHPRMNEMLTK